MPPTRTRIVAEARAWIGTPYRHQASLHGVGCDCLGLVRGVWRPSMAAKPEATPAYAPITGEDTPSIVGTVIKAVARKR